MLYIGIDGGGTKTAFVLYREDGYPLYEVQKPSCHMFQNDKKTIVSILRNGIQEVRQHHMHEDVYICAGLAGYGKEPSMRTLIEEICKEAFAPHPYLLQNDAQIALCSALGGNDGILLIAGTGSIGLAKIQDREIRCGGWGYMLGDEGSAYAIGKELLNMYCQQCDGRLPKTLLYEEVKKTCGIDDDYEMISYIAHTLKNKRDEIARFALVASSLATKGEPNAIAIFEQAGKALAILANTLAKHFTTKVSLSYIGGVWKSEELIMHAFQRAVDKHIVLHPPLHPPVYGAYILAKQQHET